MAARKTDAKKRGRKVCSAPLSRPVTPDEIIDRARQYGPASVDALADEMTSGKGMARIAAANSLLDRGFGKVGQHVELTGTGASPLALEVQISPAVAAALKTLEGVAEE